MLVIRPYAIVLSGRSSRRVFVKARRKNETHKPVSRFKIGSWKRSDMPIRPSNRAKSAGSTSRLVHAASAGAVLAIATLPGAIRAADSTWTGTASFDWNNDLNWTANAPGSTAGAAGTSTDTATFNTVGPAGAGTEIVVDA